MNYSRIYIALGSLVVIAFVIIVMVTDDTPKQTGSTATADQQEMPSGHPDVDAQADPNAPGKGNVRQDFIQELNRLREKVKTQAASDTSDVLRLARMLADSHFSAEALPLFERYHKVDPKNTDVMLDMALVYFQTEQIEKSYAITRKTIATDPANTTALYNLGALYAFEHKHDEAKKAWNDLISRYPKSEDAARAKESLVELDSHKH